MGRCGGHGADGSGVAAGAAQIAFGGDAENEEGRHSYTIGKGAGAHALRLRNGPRETEESWEIAGMLHHPRNDNPRQLWVNALDPICQVEKALGEEIGR
jgi:hypothetical protein